MGWTDSHLHLFIAGRTMYGVPDPEMFDEDEEIFAEKRHKLVDLAPAGESSFIYQYDFGDNWQPR